jgi:hypothetical protein
VLLYFYGCGTLLGHAIYLDYVLAALDTCVLTYVPLLGWPLVYILMILYYVARSVGWVNTVGFGEQQSMNDRNRNGHWALGIHTEPRRRPQPSTGLFGKGKVRARESFSGNRGAPVSNQAG